METSSHSKIQIEFCHPRALLHCPALQSLAHITGVDKLVPDGLSDRGLPIVSGSLRVGPQILQSRLKIQDSPPLPLQLEETETQELKGFNALLNGLPPGTYPCTHGLWTCPEGNNFRIEVIGIDPIEEP